MKRAVLLGCVCAITLTSCATIMNGRCQTVGITSDPACADIYIDQQYKGKTPMKASLTRKDSHTVCIECDGYEPYSFRFEPRFSKWTIGNIVSWGLIGVAVDAGTGAIFRLTPDQVQVGRDNKALAQLKEDDKFVTVVLNADPSWEKIGQMKPIASAE